MPTITLQYEFNQLQVGFGRNLGARSERCPGVDSLILFQTPCDSCGLLQHQ